MHHERLSKVERITYRIAQIAFRLGFMFVVAISVVSTRPPTMLERVLEDGVLRIISRNGPTTYYEGPQGMTGFEYVLASAFAKQLGVKLEVSETEDVAQMLDAVGGELGEFAAAGLAITPKQSSKVLFSKPYLNVTQKLVYRAGEKRPRKVEDLFDKRIVVVANSAHAENLRQLRRTHHQLRWEEVFDVETIELLEMVHKGEIDHTIVDSNSYDVSNSLYPKARIAFDISEAQSLAWAFPLSGDKTLYDRATRFFEKMEASGKLTDIQETFYGHVGELNYSDSLLFAHRLKTRLPKWSDKLKAAADTVGLDWRLLAALSYQESHWNPKAVSRTGVKGFMMLTLPTAKEVGIKNRLNATQSINGGATYFHKIHNRVPERIQEPDRTWIALAAYNLGFGHVEDARILTEHRGANPDKWSDIREDLLLLSKRKYYKHTKHGYARGWEAVQYVQNIRNYYAIIAWHDKEAGQQLALSEDKPENYAEFSRVVTEAVKTISGPSAEL